jgi:hypothetical protein
MNGEIAEAVRRTSGLTLRARPFSSTDCLLFAEQWDPGSPWHDRRVRLAATDAVDRAQKRAAILHRIQQLMHEKAMYLPLWQLASLSRYGPRVAESGLGLITDYPWAAPYEEVTLKAQ